jgi:hypothetical protein
MKILISKIDGIDEFFLIHTVLFITYICYAHKNGFAKIIYIRNFQVKCHSKSDEPTGKIVAKFV